MLNIDNRYKAVKRMQDEAYNQMVGYFQARYSWGQPCDSRRANDWAHLCCHLLTCQLKGLEVKWHDGVRFPSGNTGSPAGLVGVYHDGWELLQDLGLNDPE